MTTEKKTPQPEYRYAGFWIRFVAIFIDVFIIGVIQGSITYISRDNYAISGLLGLLIALYFPLMAWKYGATLGKMAVGLKIVRVDDGKDVNLGQAFLREWIGRIISSILYIGYIYAGFDAHKQGFHDKIAKTYVVRK